MSKRQNDFVKKYDLEADEAFNVYKESKELVLFFSRFGYREGFNFYRDLVESLNDRKQIEQVREAFAITRLTYIRDFYKTCNNLGIDVQTLERWKIENL